MNFNLIKTKIASKLQEKNNNHRTSTFNTYAFYIANKKYSHSISVSHTSDIYAWMDSYAIYKYMH